MWGRTIKEVGLTPCSSTQAGRVIGAVVVGAIACSAHSPAPDPSPGLETVVYSNDFNGPVGTTYPEWSVASYSWTSNAAGTIQAGAATELVSNVDSANSAQRFLGELGGPIVLESPPYDSQHFVRVSESIALRLTGLPAHSALTLTLDLYVLKSWDGNNETYGPDRWSVAIDGGPPLLATTFSNNFKTGGDLSLQDYPAANSPPQSGAAAANTLGYGFWFGDSTYHLAFNLSHTASSATIVFSSSLNEGKSEPSRGTRDESWGLDNVRVTIR